MSAAKVDLTGGEYDRWTVIGRSLDLITPSGRQHRQWACRCECGAVKDVVESNLLRGQSRSCGCLRREILPEARRLARLRRQVEKIAAAVSS